MILDSSFSNWFTKLTEHNAPRFWQSDLAEESVCRDRLIRIPTGLGKTEGVLAAWSFHRLCQADDRWPPCLVGSLPMSVFLLAYKLISQVLAQAMRYLAKNQKLYNPQNKKRQLTSFYKKRISVAKSCFLEQLFLRLETRVEDSGTQHRPLRSGLFVIVKSFQE